MVAAATARMTVSWLWKTRRAAPECGYRTGNVSAGWLNPRGMVASARRGLPQSRAAGRQIITVDSCGCPGTSNGPRSSTAGPGQSGAELGRDAARRDARQAGVRDSRGWGAGRPGSGRGMRSFFGHHKPPLVRTSIRSISFPLCRHRPKDRRNGILSTGASPRARRPHARRLRARRPRGRRSRAANGLGGGGRMRSRSTAMRYPASGEPPRRRRTATCSTGVACARVSMSGRCSRDRSRGCASTPRLS